VFNKNSVGQEDGIKTILTLLLMGLLFFPTFFQGLFYEKQMLITDIFVAIICIAFVVLGLYRKDFKVFPLSLLDSGLLVLWAAYVISVFNAAKPATAVDMVMKITAITLVYFVISRFCQGVEKLNTLLRVIYAAGVIIALIGLAGFTGMGSEVFGMGGRISSVFQYPNALGAYLTAVFFMGLYLYGITEQKWLKAVISGSNILTMTAFFGTLSRGAFLVLVVTFILYFVVQHNNHRKNLFLAVIMLVISAVSYNLLKNMTDSSGAMWGIIVIGFLAGGVLPFLIDKVMKVNVSKQKMVKIAGVIVVLVGVIVLAYMVKAGGLQRFTQINFQDQGVLVRLYFFKDAVSIIKDNPLIGIGGGGWDAVYLQYRTIPYIAREVHNFYLQTGVETGLVGLLGLAVIAVGTVILFIRVRRQESEAGALGAVAVTGLAVLALHAAIDVTMSYGAILLLFWVLLGYLRALDQPETEEPIRFNLGGYIVVAVAVALLGLASATYTGIKYSEDAARIVKRYDYTGHKKDLETALTLNPWRAEYYVQLARAERVFMNKEEAKRKQALVYAQRAVELEPNNPEIRLVKANMHFLNKEIEQGMAETEKAYELDPWNQVSYEALTYMYATVGKYYGGKGDIEKMTVYFKKAIGVNGLLKKQKQKVAKAELDLVPQNVPEFSTKMKGDIAEVLTIMRKMGIQM
jgi:O-antigen ligase